MGSLCLQFFPGQYGCAAVLPEADIQITMLCPVRTLCERLAPAIGKLSGTELLQLLQLTGAEPAFELTDRHAIQLTIPSVEEVDGQLYGVGGQMGIGGCFAIKPPVPLEERNKE